MVAHRRAGHRGRRAAVAILLEDFPDIDEARGGRRAARPDSGRSPTAGFPTAEGIARDGRRVTAGAPWLSRRWRRWGWVAVGGLVVTRFLASPVVVRLRSRPRSSAGSPAPRSLVALGAPSRRPTADAIKEGLARSGLPLREPRRRRASTPAAPRPYFGVGAGRHALLREGARRRPAQRRPAVPRCTGRCSGTTSATSGPFSSLRRAVEHEAFVALGRPRPRHPHAADARPSRPPSRTPSCSPTRRSTGRSLDGVPPEEVTDEVLGRGLAAARSPPRATASPTATCASPTSSSAPTAGSG